MPVHVKLYSVLFILLACVAGCQHATGEKPSTIDLLMQTESMLTAGMETLKTGIDIGTVDTTTSEYARVYAGLEKANTVMDSAWAAYRAGSLEQADASRRIALSTYQSIRPLLYQIAGEAP